MAGAARYASFYRKYPHVFAEQYLHLRLKRFQKILLVMMILCNNFVYNGSRGQGKTFLTAVALCIRCTLWSGTKCVISSGTRGQAGNVLEKIMLELIPNSPELAAEIDMKQTKINGTNAQIVWKNTSFIKVATASDSARGSRCNILLLDEYRLIPLDVINTVLRKFLTQRRMPKYNELTEEERNAEYAKEKNKMIFCSSAYFSDHWSYTKSVDTFNAMLTPGHKDFVCCLPYELSIKEGLLDPDIVESEMLESDFSEIKYMMEYEAVFYNSASDAFFDYTTVAKNRHITYPMLPAKLAAMLKSDTDVRIAPKMAGEKRLLSADIALMASSNKAKNDATAIHITRLIPTKAGRYTVNLVYSETNEGYRTEEEALLIRRLYEEYDCDYIVLDAKNVGLSILDALSNDISDPETGEIFPALCTCNNDDLAARCVVKGAPKVIWAILGNAKFNSDVALLLREGFKSGRMRLLLNEYDGEEAMNKIKGFGSLSTDEKTKLLMPYINTTLLINELVNLKHDESNGLVRLSEKSGMRKDRYSSLSYNYYVALELEKEARKHNARSIGSEKEEFIFRAPKIKRN